MTFRGGNGFDFGGSSPSGTVTRATAIRPPNRAMTAASPTLSRAVTRPSSLTVAISGAFD